MCRTDFGQAGELLMQHFAPEELHLSPLFRRSGIQARPTPVLHFRKEIKQQHHLTRNSRAARPPRASSLCCTATAYAICPPPTPAHFLHPWLAPAPRNLCLLPVVGPSHTLQSCVWKYHRCVCVCVHVLDPDRLRTFREQGNWEALEGRSIMLSSTGCVDADSRVFCIT